MTAEQDMNILMLALYRIAMIQYEDSGQQDVHFAFKARHRTHCCCATSRSHADDSISQVLLSPRAHQCVI